MHLPLSHERKCTNFATGKLIMSLGIITQIFLLNICKHKGNNNIYYKYTLEVIDSEYNAALLKVRAVASYHPT